jgi:hypothetical protein
VFLIIDKNKDATMNIVSQSTDEFNTMVKQRTAFTSAKASFFPMAIRWMETHSFLRIRFMKIGIAKAFRVWK